MTLLITIPDVFIGTPEQFSDCYFSLGGLTMQEITEVVTSWAKELEFAVEFTVVE